MNNKNKLKLLIGTLLALRSLSAQDHYTSDVSGEEGNGWCVGVNVHGLYFPETKMTATVLNTATAPVTQTATFTLNSSNGYGISGTLGKFYDSNSVLFEIGYFTTSKSIEEQSQKAGFGKQSLLSLTLNGFVNLETATTNIVPYLGAGIGAGCYTLDTADMSSSVQSLTVGSTTPGSLSAMKSSQNSWSLMAQAMLGLLIPVSDTTNMKFGYKFSTPFSNVEFASSANSSNKVSKNVAIHHGTIGIDMIYK